MRDKLRNREKRDPLETVKENDPGVIQFFINSALQKETGFVGT